jgi:cytochrome c oxidase subunit 4
MSEHSPTPEHETNNHGEHSDTTVIFGRTLPFPLYTVVFMVLGVLTVLEVLVAEIFTSGIKIPILLGMALAKAVLVVVFYMHLKTDSRFFAVALLVPTLIAIISMMFVLGTPAGNY